MALPTASGRLTTNYPGSNKPLEPLPFDSSSKSKQSFAKPGFFQMVVLAAVAWVLLIVGVYWFGDPMWQKVTQARSWPAVDGKIVGAKQTLVEASRNSKSYSVEVWYAFNISGVRHVDVQDRFYDYPGGDETKYQGKVVMGYNSYQADQIVAAYPQHKAVRVSVNPANPSETFIDTNDSPMYLIEKVMRWTGFLFVACVIVGIIGFERRWWGKHKMQGLWD